MFKKIPSKDKEIWIELLLHSPDSYEEGFRIIDADLEIPEGASPDIVGINARGGLVFLTMRSEEKNDPLLTTLDQSEWAGKNRGILERLYKGKGYDPQAPLLCAFLSEAFSSREIQRTSQSAALPLRLLKVHILEWKEKQGIYLEPLQPAVEPGIDHQRNSAEPAPEARPEIPQTEDPDQSGKESISESLFFKAREQIFSLSDEIEMKDASDRTDAPEVESEVDFFFKRQFLAGLRKTTNAVLLWLSPEEKENKRKEIDNDFDLEGEINRVIKKFFSLCSPQSGGKRKGKVPLRTETLSEDELSELQRPDLLS